MTRLSRRQVAERFGVCKTYVAQRFDGSLLTPIHERSAHDPNGRPRVWYDAEQVEKVLASGVWKRQRIWRKKMKPRSATEKKRRGELAAQVFALVAQGATYHQIQIATRGDPDEVAELFERATLSPDAMRARRREEEEEQAVRDRRAREDAEEERRRAREDLTRARKELEREKAKRARTG